MSSILFYSNPDGTVLIHETPTSLTLTASKEINDIYEQYFKNVATHSLIDGKNIWTFEKKNDQAISVIAQVIGNTNIKASFKYTEPVSLPTENTSEFILNPIWRSADDKVIIVEYKAASLALFCDREFGTKYSEHFKRVKGSFNMNLKHKADGSVTTPGWLFWKSEPGVFEFLQQLTGQDLKQLVRPAPEKKSYKSYKNPVDVPFSPVSITRTLVSQIGTFPVLCLFLLEELLT